MNVYISVFYSLDKVWMFIKKNSSEIVFSCSSAREYNQLIKSLKKNKYNLIFVF